MSRAPQPCLPQRQAGPAARISFSAPRADVSGSPWHGGWGRSSGRLLVARLGWESHSRRKHATTLLLILHESACFRLPNRAPRSPFCKSWKLLSASAAWSLRLSRSLVDPSIFHLDVRRWIGDHDASLHGDRGRKDAIGASEHHDVGPSDRYRGCLERRQAKVGRLPHRAVRAQCASAGVGKDSQRDTEPRPDSQGVADRLWVLRWQPRLKPILNGSCGSRSFLVAASHLRSADPAALGAVPRVRSHPLAQPLAAVRAALLTGHTHSIACDLAKASLNARHIGKSPASLRE